MNEYTNCYKGTFIDFYRQRANGSRSFKAFWKLPYEIGGRAGFTPEELATKTLETLQPMPTGSEIYIHNGKYVEGTPSEGLMPAQLPLADREFDSVVKLLKQARRDITFVVEQVRTSTR